MKQIVNRSLLVALMLGASVGVTQTSVAQSAEPKHHARGGKFENMTPEQRVEKRLEKMKSKLNLSDAQVNDLRKIMREDAAELKTAREAIKSAEGADAKKAARERMFAQMKTAKERVSAVLTEEQRTKMKEQFKEGRSKMRALKKEHRQERKELRQELQKN